jgi:Lon protease-like protein
LESKLLPLFPLDLVLLPGIPLPLHVFEPRYKEMIGECLAGKTAFGVVRAKDEEGIAEIGCTAEILTVTKEYDDGRMDIVTQGRERFEIVTVNHERAFLQAEVLYLIDDSITSTREEGAEALKLHNEILSLAGAALEKLQPDEDPQLSFHLAGTLPLDLDFKQTLLEMKSEGERVRALISYLQTILPDLRRTVHIRQKAGGNGHAH